MKWSVVSRIEAVSGLYDYEKRLGKVFTKLLNKNMFDEAIEMLIASNIIKDKKVEKIIIRHIETYKWAC